MSSFVPNKVFLRGVLLHYFNMKMKAAESHRILVEVYGGHALAQRTCQKLFARFKSGNFDLEDEQYSGHRKKFENEKLEATLEENPAQTQKEVPNTLGVDQQIISDRLKAVGMIPKETLTESKKALESVPVNDDLDEEEIYESEDEFEIDDISDDGVDNELLNDKDDEKMTNRTPLKSPNTNRPLQRRRKTKKKKKDEKKGNQDTNEK